MIKLLYSNKEPFIVHITKNENFKFALLLKNLKQKPFKGSQLRAKFSFF